MDFLSLRFRLTCLMDQHMVRISLFIMTIDLQRAYLNTLDKKVGLVRFELTIDGSLRY